MKTDLTDTTASKINKALVQGRRAIGTPAVGMVLTLVVVTDEENAYDALKAANDASREHPSRTLVVIKRVSRSPRGRTQSRLDAEVRLGADAGSGETVILRLYGEVSDHAQSVVLPLLLPDAPVVVWWSVDAPRDPAGDPLGALGQRAERVGGRVERRVHRPPDDHGRVRQQQRQDDRLGVVDHLAVQAQHHRLAGAGLRPEPHLGVET